MNKLDPNKLEAEIEAVEKKATSMLKEFRDFINKGNMLDLAIGIVIGAAFAKLTDGFMTNLINPLVGMITGGTDFSNKFVVLKAGPKAPEPYESLKAAQDAGANVLSYGAFISAIVSFLITMVVMFIVVKAYNKMKEKSAAQNAADQPAEAPAKAEDIVLLEEIRDLLKK